MFSLWFLQLTACIFEMPMVASHVTKPSMPLIELAAVIKFSDFSSHPGTRMQYIYIYMCVYVCVLCVCVCVSINRTAIFVLCYIYEDISTMFIPYCVLLPYCHTHCESRACIWTHVNRRKNVLYTHVAAIEYFFNPHTLQYTWQTILWCCATASNFIKYIFYSTRKWKTTRTELYDGISQQTPQPSRICGCLLWAHNDWFPLPSATVYHIVL